MLLILVFWLLRTMSSDFNIKTIKPNDGLKYKTQFKKKPRFRIRGAVFFILIIFFLVLFTYVLPSVTVVVVPETRKIEKEFEIQLTSDESKVDLNRNIFPARIIEASEKGEGSFEATGEKDIGDKASGQAVFYNHTGRSQPLTTQIDLINDQGIAFAVKENITIPPARVDEDGNIVPGEIVAEIEAKEPGEKGNAGPGRINISALDIERQEKIYGEISQGLSGGNSKIVVVVSQEDLDNAKDELIRELEPKVKEKLKKKAGDDMSVIDKLINFDVSEISKSMDVDAEVKNFDMSLNLKAKALVYNNKDLSSFLKDQILKELPAGQTIAESEFGPESQAPGKGLEVEVRNFDINLGMADLKIKAVFPVSEKIDLVKIKRNILGKREKEARRYILSLPNVKDVKFIFSLSLTDKIPKFENKVRVKLGEVMK